MARVAFIALTMSLLLAACAKSSPSSNGSGQGTKMAGPSGEGDLGRTGGQTGAGSPPLPDPRTGFFNCSDAEALSKPGPKAKLEASRCISRRSPPAVLNGTWPYQLDSLCACRFSCESPDLLRGDAAHPYKPFRQCFNDFAPLSSFAGYTESGGPADAGPFGDALLIDSDTDHEPWQEKSDGTVVLSGIIDCDPGDRLGRCLLQPDEIHACDASHPETSCQSLCSLLEKRQNEAAAQTHSVEMKQEPCGRSCRGVVRLDGHCYFQDGPSIQAPEIDCALSFDAENLDGVADCSTHGSDHCAVCNESQTSVPACIEGTGECVAYEDSDGGIYRDCGLDYDAGGRIKHYFEDGGAESCW